jgi:hypothetical protein
MIVAIRGPRVRSPFCNSRPLRHESQNSCLVPRAVTSHRRMQGPTKPIRCALGNICPLARALWRRTLDAYKKTKKDKQVHCAWDQHKPRSEKTWAWRAALRTAMNYLAKQVDELPGPRWSRPMPTRRTRDPGHETLVHKVHIREHEFGSAHVGGELRAATVVVGPKNLRQLGAGRPIGDG